MSSSPPPPPAMRQRVSDRDVPAAAVSGQHGIALGSSPPGGGSAFKYRDAIRRRRYVLFLTFLLIFAALSFWVLSIRRSHRPRYVKTFLDSVLPRVAVSDIALDNQFIPSVEVLVVFQPSQLSTVRSAQMQALCLQSHVHLKVRYVTDEDDYVCEKLAELTRQAAADWPNCTISSHCFSYSASISARIAALTSGAATGSLVLLLSSLHDPSGPTFLSDMAKGVIAETVPGASCTTIREKTSQEMEKNRLTDVEQDNPSLSRTVVDRGFEILDGEAYIHSAHYVTRRYLELPVTDSRVQGVEVVGAINGHCAMLDLDALKEYKAQGEVKRSKLRDVCRKSLTDALAFARKFDLSTNISLWEKIQLLSEAHARTWLYGTRFSYLYGVTQRRYAEVLGSTAMLPAGRYPPGTLHVSSEDVPGIAAMSVSASAAMSSALTKCHDIDLVDDLLLFGWELSFQLKSAGHRLVVLPVQSFLRPHPLQLTTTTTTQTPALPPPDEAHDGGKKPVSTLPPTPPPVPREVQALTLPSYPVDPGLWKSFSPTFYNGATPGQPQLYVVWDGYCCHCCGFASEIFSFVVPLSHRVKVRTLLLEECFCPGYPAGLRDYLNRLFISPQSYSLIPTTDVLIWISHRQPDAYLTNPLFRYRTPDYFIGRSMYEFTRIPNHWLQYLTMVNEVWVPSQWMATVFEDNGFTRSKMYSMPEPVDTAEYDPDTVTAMKLPQHLDHLRHICSARPSSDAYRFVSHFKWEPRKGWDVLLGGYHAAFKGRVNDVALYIVTFLYYPNPSGNIYNESEALGFVVDFFAERGVPMEEVPPICIVTESMLETELIRFYHAADAFVLPTRGEGWGLPLIQAMSLAKPTIATNWGGQLAFMNEQNSFLIDVDGFEEVPEAHNPYGFEAAKRWAVPSETHLTELLRYVERHAAHAATVGRRARDHVVKSFSEEAVTALVENRLSVIYRFVLSQRRARG